MALTQVVTPAWARNSETLSTEVSISADGAFDRDLTIPGATTDQLVAAVIDVSQMKLLYISSDQDITIETNNSSAPADTLTITANKPLLWYEGYGLDNPLGTDVTALYITRAAGDSATVKIRCMVDATV